MHLIIQCQFHPLDTMVKVTADGFDCTGSLLTRVATSSNKMETVSINYYFILLHYIVCMFQLIEQKWEPIDWEIIFTNPISDRVVISETYFYKLNKLEPDNPITKNLEMRCRATQRIIHRGMSNGQGALKGMFNVFNHQGNTNQRTLIIFIWSLNLVNIGSLNDTMWCWGCEKREYSFTAGGC